MKILLVVIGLAVAVATELPSTSVDNYHELIGIPEFERIKRAEDAQDFDGSRIVGGSISALGAHPHLGGLLIDLTNGQRSLCGCSLLSNTKAVTAAHCWRTHNHQARQFTIVLGSTNVNSGGVRRTTSNVQVHGSYSPLNAFSDVALITFSYVDYTNAIQNIALATGSNTYAGYMATAAGFGRINDNPQVQNSLKRHVNIPVITNAACQDTFGPFNVFSSTLCASGANGRSTCFGDSGGPLIIGSGSSRLLIGIMSFGSQWCERSSDIGFARVTSFASWIKARL